MKEHAERLMEEKKDVLNEFDKYRADNEKIKKDNKESIRTLEFELKCLKGSNKNNGQIFSNLDDSMEEDAKQIEIDQLKQKLEHQEKTMEDYTQTLEKLSKDNHDLHQKLKD